MYESEKLDHSSPVCSVENEKDRYLQKIWSILSGLLSKWSYVGQNG